ncbi:DNA transposase [Frankliniella fusca]|uniref:DNA transposase n=1 Tax=Frankliniella fusca TaxID=407009 RepID=A0AAE1LTE6_9NEOP|nr:DNA transposase [Frankliniella fusca]
MFKGQEQPVVRVRGITQLVDTYIVKLDDAQNLLMKVDRVHNYKIQLENSMRECANKKEDVLKESIKDLSETQQEVVHHFLKAAKAKGPSGIRFTAKWAYECILMRIKNAALYNHLTNHKILVMPCRSTLNGYLKHYGGAYGFQPQLLEMLKKKTEDIDAKNLRGVISIDEMKLTQGIYFDSSTLQELGFKDMGEENNEILGEDF